MNASVAIILTLTSVFISSLLIVSYNLVQEEESALPRKLPNEKPCIGKNFGYDSIACVCNASYCDEVPALPKMTKGFVVSYTTTQSGLRFEQEIIPMNSVTSEPKQNYFNVTAKTTYQDIKGFGGAFTDATGINIASLSEDAQINLLKSYYDPSGIQYNIGRIPMAGCDFSTHAYTYDDNVGDFNMSKFSLQEEDYSYKIPFIIMAKAMSERDMSFFGSPWTSPAWMKTSNSYIGEGSLKGSPGGQYYKSWALYFAKFVEAYKDQGIDIWGLTAQNEPADGQIEDFPFQCLGFTAEQQRDFIKLDMGPTLEERGHGDVKLMILDDQRLFMEAWTQTVLSDPDAAKYIDGIAVHWYTDEIVPASVLTNTHNMFPSKFILGSEACAGEIPQERHHVHLGSWFRGSRYGLDITQDLQHFVTGWVDWNLALDMEGGPNWVSNFVDALIIVNKDADEFYKQPSFYHMGHFSKFIEEGSVRIETSAATGIPATVRQIGFLLPDGLTRVLVVSNIGDDVQHVSIYDSQMEYAAKVTLEGNSIKTFIYTSGLR